MQTPISIHALHEESDVYLIAEKPDIVGISIHALHEESDVYLIAEKPEIVGISIHALHEESDPSTRETPIMLTFQSTLSMRRATRTLAGIRRNPRHFNPRSP